MDAVRPARAGWPGTTDTLHVPAGSGSNRHAPSASVTANSGAAPGTSVRDRLHAHARERRVHAHVVVAVAVEVLEDAPGEALTVHRPHGSRFVRRNHELRASRLCMTTTQSPGRPSAGIGIASKPVSVPVSCETLPERSNRTTRSVPAGSYSSSHGLPSTLGSVDVGSR